MNSKRNFYSRLIPWVIFGLLAVLLFRPHGDTFTALDHSGYRMMGYAFAQGRGLHEVDHVLPEVPPEIRQSLMLLPYMLERNSRDRSFLIAYLDDPKTEPFFYPLLPALAAGLERILPGFGLDLVTPLFGLLFCGVFLWLGSRAGGGWGVLVAAALILGTPWPLWLFRGFYVEACGAACLAVAIAIYYRQGSTLPASLLAGVAAGLSVSFHPVFIIPALPVMAMLALDPKRTWTQALSVLAGFAAGISVLLAMTEWMCRPYGDFSISSMASNFRVSASHRLPILFAGVSAILFGIGFVTKPLWKRRAGVMMAHPVARLLLIALAAMPLIYTATWWRYADLVRHGLSEGWGGIRIPLGVLIAGGVVGVLASKNQPRSFLLFGVFLVTLPAFAYLKGAEQMGMWSQRRLISAYTLLALSVLPWISTSIARLLDLARGRERFSTGLIVAGLLGFAGLANLVRWPAPYMTRVEAGGLDFVEEVKSEIGNRFVMFDYHPFSFPFAVDNRTRAAGIGQDSRHALGDIAKWLGEKSISEEVWWASAYANPGLEDGVILEPVSFHTAHLARVVSKEAFPARTSDFDISLSLLRARPVRSFDDHPVMDKVLDGGPLGLRDPWGTYRRTTQNETGEIVPAEWSRQGSGVVGPVPRPGSAVKLTIQGESGQAKAQQIHIIPPWGGEPAVLVVEPVFGTYTAILQRPAGSGDLGGAFTGVYRLESPTPYDPSQEGIRGFADDLGILVHRVRIEYAPMEQ